MQRQGVFSMSIIERAVAWICNLDYIRETILFTRTLNRFYP
jgi:aspartyl/asparaginyl-tRNA synthetase